MCAHAIGVPQSRFEVNLPSTQSRLVCPITIGRQHELNYLRGLVDQLQVSSVAGTTVLITGEAGIGKTRLIAEAREYAASRGVRVLRGAAIEIDRGAPYAPVAVLLNRYVRDSTPQQVLASLGPGAEAVARLLPGLAAFLKTDPSKGEWSHQQLLQGLLLAFEELIQRGPTLLVFEDMHWADEASLELLLHLARSA